MTNKIGILEAMFIQECVLKHFTSIVYGLHICSHFNSGFGRPMQFT